MAWDFKIEQGGIEVVGGSAPTLQEAMREVGHYAMQYSQDGPLKLTIEPSVGRKCDVCGELLNLDQNCYWKEDKSAYYHVNCLKPFVAPPLRKPETK